MANLKKKIVENGKNDQFVDEIETKSSFLWQPNVKKNRESLSESDQRAHISPKMWCFWVTAETISKNMGSLGDSSTENRGSLEPYIHVTSIMGVPPGEKPLQSDPFEKPSVLCHALNDFKGVLHPDTKISMFCLFSPSSRRKSILFMYGCDRCV